MPLQLIDAVIPDHGPPGPQPQIPAATYRARLDATRRAMRETGLDALAVYADREHSANLAWLTGFDPRFEEALLILRADHAPVLITGPENQGYAAISPLSLDLRLYPPMGLLGQDRAHTQNLDALLTGAGLRAGQTVGTAGWKYFGDAEALEPDTWIELPAYLVEAIRRVAAPGRVVNAGALFMHPATGLRAINDVDQLAQFEHAACHASNAVRRVIDALEPGLTEFELASEMRLPGLPLSCHPMLSTGHRTKLGLASPSDKRIDLGEPFQTAIGLWGALTCRAGWVTRDEGDLPEEAHAYLDTVAKPYFDCAAAWYETVGIGVTGGEIDALVRQRLAAADNAPMLNPGHQIHLDEWMNTPIYPGSTIPLTSGMALQLDIIPVKGPANIEDGIALLDADARTALAERHPDAWSRIEARRAFMADTLGIHLKPETLPLSSLAGCFAPFLLAPNRILARPSRI